MPQYLVQFHHSCANDKIAEENDNAACSKSPPSCLHFCKISGGLFVFLNMCRISRVYANFSVYSGDKEKLSENFERRNAYEPI